MSITTRETLLFRDALDQRGVIQHIVEGFPLPHGWVWMRERHVSDNGVVYWGDLTSECKLLLKRVEEQDAC